jgi:hypothetical protein
MPEPSPTEFLNCWDWTDPDTGETHCSTFTAGSCTYWSPSMWLYNASVPMPNCGVWPASCGVQDPLPECCISAQDWRIDLGLPTYWVCLSSPTCDETIPSNYVMPSCEECASIPGCNPLSASDCRICSSDEAWLTEFITP